MSGLNMSQWSHIDEVRELSIFRAVLTASAGVVWLQTGAAKLFLLIDFNIPCLFA